MEKLINDLYEYSQTLDCMPPRGDGAQLEVACEVHRLVNKITKKLSKQLDNPEKVSEYYALLVDLVEQMILDKIDSGLTPEVLEYIA